MCFNHQICGKYSITKFRLYVYLFLKPYAKRTFSFQIYAWAGTKHAYYKAIFSCWQQKVFFGYGNFVYVVQCYVVETKECCNRQYRRALMINEIFFHFYLNAMRMVYIVSAFYCFSTAWNFQWSQFHISMWYRTTWYGFYPMKNRIYVKWFSIE